MSEDQRTLWVGNLHENVTDELVYELFLQTGPIEKIIFPCQGEGETKKNRGHAYILFKHPDSVRFASQVLEGTTMFDYTLELKARTLPVTYRSSGPSNSNTFSKSRYDNSSLRGGFQRSSTWHGRDEFAPRGRGGGSYRNRMGGGGSNYNNQTSNGGYNNTGYNNQTSSSYWQGSGDANNSSSSYRSTDMEEKRQRVLQQQNLTIQNHNQQQQQQIATVSPQMYGVEQQSQDQQQTWPANSYSTSGTWSMQAGEDGSASQGYGNQYSGWYQPQS